MFHLFHYIALTSLRFKNTILFYAKSFERDIFKGKGDTFECNSSRGVCGAAEDDPVSFSLDNRSDGAKNRSTALLRTLSEVPALLEPLVEEHIQDAIAQQDVKRLMSLEAEWLRARYTPDESAAKYIMTKDFLKLELVIFLFNVSIPTNFTMVLTIIPTLF